jgi:hypothetical protein
MHRIGGKLGSGCASAHHRAFPASSGRRDENHFSKASSTGRSIAGGLVEHRWGKRIPVDIGLRISARPGMIGVGRILELSVGVEQHGRDTFEGGHMRRSGFEDSWRFSST